jgi:2OG-Fe(II) oxygenase superfamily
MAKFQRSSYRVVSAVLYAGLALAVAVAVALALAVASSENAYAREDNSDNSNTAWWDAQETEIPAVYTSQLPIQQHYPYRHQEMTTYSQAGAVAARDGAEAAKAKAAAAAAAVAAATVSDITDHRARDAHKLIQLAIERAVASTLRTISESKSPNGYGSSALGGAKPGPGGDCTTSTTQPDLLDVGPRPDASTITITDTDVDADTAAVTDSFAIDEDLIGSSCNAECLAYRQRVSKELGLDYAQLKHILGDYIRVIRTRDEAEQRAASDRPDGTVHTQIDFQTGGVLDKLSLSDAMLSRNVVSVDTGTGTQTYPVLERTGPGFVVLDGIAGSALVQQARQEAQKMRKLLKPGVTGIFGIVPEIRNDWNLAIAPTHQNHARQSFVPPDHTALHALLQQLSQVGVQLNELHRNASIGSTSKHPYDSWRRALECGTGQDTAPNACNNINDEACEHNICPVDEYGSPVDPLSAWTLPLLDLNRTEYMLAHYPANSGARYALHTDNLKAQQAPSSSGSSGGRAISLVYYLNPTWQEAHGGKLRLYLDDVRCAPYTDTLCKSQPYLELEPLGDRMVLFPSHSMRHEVRRNYGERYAIAVWFHAAANSVHDKQNT